MGEIVGAGLLAHVPTIVLPEAERRELNEGKEITLVTGLRKLRTDVFETVDYDTVVVLDSHWATIKQLRAPNPTVVPSLRRTRLEEVVFGQWLRTSNRAYPSEAEPSLQLL
jgi:hypothetical protein